MDKHFDVVVDLQGNAVPGATVTVTAYETGAISSLFADDEVTAISNPMTSDAYGRYEFCAEAGIYIVTETKNGASTQKRHVVLVGTVDIPEVRRIFARPQYAMDARPLIGTSYVSYLNVILHQVITLLINQSAAVFSTCTFV